MSAEKLSGVEELRRTVALLNNTSEDFNTRFNVAQLLKIGDAYRRCEYDFTPDRWTKTQVREALRGIVPRWDEEERPVHSTPRAKLEVKVESDPEFRRLMRHALGLDRAKVSYRNYYVAVDGTEPAKQWAVLCLVGFARRERCEAKHTTFSVTDEGRAFLGAAQ